MSSFSSETLPTDYNMEVLKGNVPGSTMVSILGHDEALTTTRTTVHPTATTLNIEQSGIHATPALVKVASTSGNDISAGSGAITVLLIGLDASGNAQSETIALNGQAEVTSANTYCSISKLRVLTTGATNWNEGSLWVGTGTFTGGIPATKYLSADIRANRAMTAYYAVPTGKTLYLRALTLMVRTSNKDVNFWIEQSLDGILWITEARFGMEAGEFQGKILSVPGIPAGSYVRIEAQSSGASTDATCILGCELVDD